MPIVKVDALEKYLNFMFTEKQSKSVVGCKSDYYVKVLPCDELQAKLFYPSHIDL